MGDQVIQQKEVFEKQRFKPNENLPKESLPALEAQHNMLGLADNHISNSGLAAT